MHGPYIHNGFLLFAFVFFLLDALKVPHARVSWIPLGFACVVGAFLFPFFV